MEQELQGLESTSYRGLGTQLRLSAQEARGLNLSAHFPVPVSYYFTFVMFVIHSLAWFCFPLNTAPNTEH